MLSLDELSEAVTRPYDELFAISRKLTTALAMRKLLDETQYRVCIHTTENVQFTNGPSIADLLQDIDLNSLAAPFIRDKLTQLHSEIDADVKAWQRKQRE